MFKKEKKNEENIFFGILQKNANTLLEKSGIRINGKNSWDIKIHDYSIFFDVFLKGSIGLGDGYTNGKWDVEHIDVFFEKLLRNQTRFSLSLMEIIYLLRDAILNTQIGKQAFAVAEKHYDLGNTMYTYMLGESMGYSSGMFLHPTDTLTKAQYNKFDQLCKKLHLKPGMKVLEIGSGWGTFAAHAMKNYGVEVVGLTVSKEQKAFAEKTCKNLPAKFLLLDYQNLDEKYVKYFDRVVSIEMIEAVGKKNLVTFFSTIAKVLKDDGLLGLQAIIGTGNDDTFLSTRIFPNGHVPSEKEIVLSSWGLLRIKHWESFGKDYDKTLLQWEKNFRTNWKQIVKITDTKGVKMYDEKFYRMWRYYLLVCAASFRVGLNDVAQIIMSKPNSLSPLK